jgi:predicted metal-dependent peptidase
MKETTASDLTSSEATEEQIASFHLDPHLINLMLNEPFFSHVLRGFNKVKTDSIPTAGVGVRGQCPTLFWNIKFLASLTPKCVRGVMKHECYHWILKHVTSRKKEKEEHLLWNWATDLAINSMIERDALPDEGLFPGEKLNLSKITDPDMLEKWKKVSNLIESFPKMMSADWYFESLKSDEEVSETINQSGEGTPVFIDEHGEWGEMSDEDKQVVEGKIRQAMSEASRKCDSNGNWGSIPSEMRNEIRKMASSEIDWTKVLASFCGRSQRLNKRSTMKRINRKYPYIHAGKRHAHTANIAIYMDQSGSVSDQDIALLFNELNNLGKKVTFTLFPFDTQVDEEASIIWKRGSSIPLVRTRCGGTSFDAVARHADDNSGKFDGHIILTDGECSDPGPTRLRRAWVIVPNRKLYFTPDSRDVVIQMNGED